MDVAEGADIVMVKPALAYLDVIRAVSDEVNMPIAAYAVSGEYAMIEAAAERGWIDKERVVMETLLGMRRAGADIIISYHAPYACKLLDECARASEARTASICRSKPIYKFVELSIVTDETIEEVVNVWVGKGWVLDGIRFVTTEASRRPQMAFVSFTRDDDRGDPPEPCAATLAKPGGSA